MTLDLDRLDAVPAVPMARRGSDELRPIDPLPPVTMDAAQGGGGTPNPIAAVEHRSQISPSSKSPGCSTEVCSTQTSSGGLADLLPADVPRPDLGSMDRIVRSDGTPTREALDRLREEARTPSFDADLAIALLTVMGDGMSMTRACVAVGVKRAVVLAWKRMVPEFAALLEVVETDLGSYWRDRAADEVESGDPALASARLRVAAAYDRRIAKGDGEAGSVVNVQVNW